MALATAPAAVAQQPEFLKPLGWYPEETAVPASVVFNDVAAVGGLVVAVGTDTATGGPVIYNRTGGAWQTAPVDPLPTPGSLDDVVLDGATGWAVGTEGDPLEPLVLEVVGGTWRDRSGSLAAGTVPTAVALDGAGAMIGDELGNVRRVAAGGTASDRQKAPGAGAINGIALFSSSPGIAVAGWAEMAPVPENRVRIYDLGAVPLLDADEEAEATQVDMTGLAALSRNQAVAIDSTGRTWRLASASGQNNWIQEAQLLAPGDTSKLDCVASVDDGPSPWDGAGWATEFVAGKEAGAGVIWQRTRWTTDPAFWERDTVPAGTPALSGVAATAWNAAWAVGAGGTILRYWQPPDPEAEAAWRAAQQQDEQQPEQTGTPTSGDTQEQTQEQTQEPTQEKQTTIISLRQWQPSGSSSLEPGEDRIIANGIVVDDGDRSTPRRKRLVRRVRVVFRHARSGRRKLIVRFGLTRRARVRVSAKRGKRVIARKRARTLRRGRHKLVLRVRGKKPPSSLKLVARRAPRKT